MHLRSLSSLSLLVLASSLLLAPGTVHGAPSTVVGEIAKLEGLPFGKIARISVRTPEGIQPLTLWRQKSPRTSVVSVNDAPLAPEFTPASPLLFQGRIRFRQGQSPRSQLSGVAASIYRGKLKLHFYGHRSTRLYTLSSKELKSGARAAITHLPSSFPIRCAKDALPTPEGAATIGAAALFMPAKSHRVLDLALDADYEFFQALGSNLQDALAEIDSVVNIVNGIYRDQLTVSVVAVAKNVFTSASQPYLTSNAEALLDSVAAYRNVTPFSAPNNSGHLLTGKTMFVPGFGTGIVGISYLSINDDFSDPGTICRYGNQYSYTVTSRVSANTAYTAVVTAHELGHNLSLFHVNSGTMKPAPLPTDTAFAMSSMSNALTYIESFGACLAQDSPSVHLNSIRIHRGKFVSSFSTDDVGDQTCKLRVFGSDSLPILESEARRNSEATLLLGRTITSSGTRNFSATPGYRSNGGKTKYYIAAELRCAGEVVAMSEARSVTSRLSSFLPKLKSVLKDPRKN
ncbi:MAG: hypothetical protein J0M12_15520 [Deltaproteobacteria bacterium]|nr:hypothetical protein [Deltaproteobacteria bacterium]